MLLKKQNGFTLIEIIVSIAILSIVMVSISQIFLSSLNFNAKANDNYNAQSDAQIIMSRIQSDIQYANSVTINSDSPDSFSSGTEYIYLLNNVVVKNTGTSAGDAHSIMGVSKGYTYSVLFKKSSSKSLNVSITVFKDSKQLYQMSTDIYINNLFSSNVSGTDQGIAIAYTVPADMAITVSAIGVTSQYDSISVNKGTLQMSTSVSPSNASNKSVTWSVNDTSIATIDSSGWLTAVSNGTVTVTATANDGSGITGLKVITISNQVQVILINNIMLKGQGGATSIQYSRNNGHIHTLQIIATIDPPNATNQSLTWSVDNTDYATINGNGLLTAGKTGGVSVIVTAKANDGSNKSASIPINITN